MSAPSLSSTPHLVVDLDVVKRNIDTMQARANKAGVALRPHVKTHKIPRLAQLQRDAGARGITVATIGEAEVFADAGFDDIFVAYPLWLDDAKAQRLVALSQRIRVSIGCDSIESARNSVRAMGSRAAERISTVLELDSGHHRTGIRPDEAGEIGRAIVNVGLPVVGVFTFPGHSYRPDMRAAAAASEHEALRAGAAALTRNGVPADVRSGGASPSMAFVPSTMSGAGGYEVDFAPTEMRPGAYVFNDAQQWELGACSAEEIALTAHATVVSHTGGRMVVDAGSKTLAPDRAPWASGNGRLLDYPDARIVQLSEHHAVVDMAGAALPALGSTVRVVPNHCCNAINNADAVRVVDGSSREYWPVAARGLNS